MELKFGFSLLICTYKLLFYLFTCYNFPPIKQNKSINPIFFHQHFLKMLHCLHQGRARAIVTFHALSVINYQGAICSYKSKISFESMSVLKCCHLLLTALLLSGHSSCFYVLFWQFKTGNFLYFFSVKAVGHCTEIIL